MIWQSTLVHRNEMMPPKKRNYISWLIMHSGDMSCQDLKASL